MLQINSLGLCCHFIKTLFVVTRPDNGCRLQPGGPHKKVTFNHKNLKR